MPPPRTRDDPALKARLRREVRARRDALPEDEARRASRLAIHQLWQLPCMARARRIAMYLPAGSELDATPLALQAWARGRSLFLPVISGFGLRFAPFHPGAELRANRFRIPEPVAHPGDLYSPRQLDVIIAPLVAFDRTGHRLGMGGGYYDKTLSFLRQRSLVSRPHFIAIAFAIQEIEVVPHEEWDVLLDAVVTEKGTCRFT